MTAALEPVDVAVGVVFNREGQFLLAQRPEGKPMAGYWEFPGGKLERGETVLEALRREFEEELGLSIGIAYPWAQHVVRYPHALVRLHFWRCFDWQGEPQSLEGQQFRWESIERITTTPWLAGALALRRWLALPPHYAVSNATAIGERAFLAQFETACRAGLRMVQLREKTMEPECFARLFALVLPIARQFGTRLLVNSYHPPQFWEQADGVHLSSAALSGLSVRPACDWCSASVHDALEVAAAQRLGCDFAVLGPVATTASHPQALPLGWAAFSALAQLSGVPVYAIGGLKGADLGRALESGAHGIASLTDGLTEPFARLAWL